MTRFPMLLVAGMLAFALPAAHADPLAVDPARSQIVFVSRQMNVPVEGRFRRFAAQIEIDAGSPEATAEVIRKPWLHVQQFPKAAFVSTAVRPLGGERYEVTGQMTIKGKTLPLTAPFTVKSQGGVLVFEGVLTLKRLEYGIGDGPWNDPDTVANEVQIRFRFAAK